MFTVHHASCDASLSVLCSLAPTYQSARRYFPPFLLCGYSFTLLADPSGNPRAADQAEAAGAARIEKGLSVYLGVFFPQEHPDTPPWGGGFAFPHPFPPPPLQLGPGHPWDGHGAGSDADASEHEGNERREGDGGDKMENGQNGDGESDGTDEVGGSAPGEIVNCGVVGDGVASAAATATLENQTVRPAAAAGAWTVAAGGATMVRRDPHGLRRRRRRFRKREGKVDPFSSRSHVGDPAVIGRESCAAFSLSAVNRGGGKDVTWVSSMDGDRFYPGRSSWGVHCLLPTSIMQVYGTHNKWLWPAGKR